MPQLPTIQSILSTSGLVPNPRGGQEAALLLAAALADGSQGWGLCPLGGQAPGYPEPLTKETAQGLLDELVVPTLTNRSWSSFRQAAAALAGLRQKTVITRELPPSGNVSRRDVIAGRVSAVQQPRLERVELERPLHPALRLAVEQALLAAEAAWRGGSQAAVLAQAYGRALPSAAPPLQLPIRGGQALQLLPQVAALAYTVRSAEPAQALGSQGEKLQGFVRRLAQSLQQEAGASDQPVLALNLDTRGALGRLFDNNPGQILGALYGLERAAKPLPLRVVDPLSPGASAEQLAELRQLLHFRRMKTELVARAGLNTAVDVQTVVGEAASSMVWLDLERLGSLAETMTAVQTAQAADVRVIVGAGPADLLAQVAFAADPALIAAPRDQAGLAVLVNELNRLAARP